MKETLAEDDLIVKEHKKNWRNYNKQVERQKLQRMEKNEETRESS